MDGTIAELIKLGVAGLWIASLHRLIWQRDQTIKDLMADIKEMSERRITEAMATVSATGKSAESNTRMAEALATMADKVGTLDDRIAGRLKA